MHCCQYCVAARLEWVMQVLAYFRCICHGGKGFGAHVFRVRAHKAHTTNAIHSTDSFEQLGKHGTHTAHTCFTTNIESNIATIRVDILAEQAHFSNALCSKIFYFTHDVGKRSADFFTAYRRNNAKGTRVVATNLNSDPRIKTLLTFCWQCAGEQCVIF